MQLNEFQQYIRFSISQLSPTNGQAEFEKICLYFSRQRIHKNILPATGPVQAGGDQGRDFETFHTYLASSLIGKSSFVADFSEGPVVFACSLEQNPTKKNGKVLSDVHTITSSGTKVDRVYFFSGQDIPVAARHKCQEDARRLYNVSLEIIDAQALSQHLADPDLFWIATQFLKISSEHYPERMADDWYTDLKNDYKARIEPPSTFQEFEEVKSAVRFIYKNEELKSDLVFWLPKFDQIIKAKRLGSSLIRKAIYEKFVASLIGLGIIEGQEADIQYYFDHFEDYYSTSELEDAQHLLSFCQTSLISGLHTIPKDYLDAISDRMEQTLESMIKNSPTDDNKCALLEIKANFSFHDRRGELDFITNVNKYIAGLDELLGNLEQSHFFPLGRLSDHLNHAIEILLDTPIDVSELEEIAERLDLIIEKKGGSSVLADKLRKRASIYLASGENLKAIQVLHDLKVRLFNRDTLAGSIKTCLLIGKTYEKLKLFMAGKYYSLVGAYLAYKSRDTSIAHLITQGISSAAGCDYMMGSWAGYMNYVTLLTGTHVRMTKDFDVYDDEDTMKILYYPALILEASRRYFPEATATLEGGLSALNIVKDDILEYQIILQKKIEENVNDFKTELMAQIHGIPFNDFGSERTIAFNASGCDWHFKFRNDYNTTIAAEEFISTFQVLLLELSNDDLYLMPGIAEVQLELCLRGKPEITERSSDKGQYLHVTLPLFNGQVDKDKSKHAFDYLVYAQGVIYNQCLLPYTEYQKILEPIFKHENLLGKVTFGQSYDVLYKEFQPKTNFDGAARTCFSNPFMNRDYKLPINPNLLWKSDLSIKYNQKEAMEAIHNRLENLKNPVSVSLPKLCSSVWFQRIIRSLREKGWLDWHLLHAVVTIIVNHKAQFRTAPKTMEEVQELFYGVFNKNESEWYQPITESILHQERIELELEKMMPVLYLPTFKLENHVEVPNCTGILKVFENRFRFFEDGKEIVVFNF